MKDLKQKSIDAVIWNLIARYGIQLFSLIIGIILARLLTPADYGLIGMVTVFFALALVFVNSGFGKAYIQKKDANEVDASTIFFFNIFVSIFLYFLLWFSAPLIGGFYEQPQLKNLIRVSAIVLIISAFGMMQNTMLTKDVNFKKKTIISLFSTLISGIVGVIAALSEYGVWSLVFQQIARVSVNVSSLWIFYQWRPKLVFSLKSMRSLFSYGAWVLLSSLMSTLFSNIYVLVIGKFFPVAQLGFYTKAKGYQNMISQQPTTAISTVSFPVLSKVQDDKMASKNAMRKFMTHTLFLIAFIATVLMVIARPLFLILLTEKWLPMVPYFQLLLITGFLYPINLYNIQLLNAQGKSKANFNLGIIKNILSLLNIVIMYRFGVLYIIYGQVLLSLISLFINSFYSKKLIDYDIFEQLMDVSKTLFISLFIILLGFPIISFVTNDYLKIMFGIFFGGGSYLVLHYLFNKELLISNFVEIKSKLKINK